MSDLYEKIAASDAPWARLLTDHLNAWFERFHRGTMQHDPLTLTVALQLPFVDLGLERVDLGDIGRMSYDRKGREVFLSYSADYAPFNTWLTRQLCRHL
jgi:hypothetical protein